MNLVVNGKRQQLDVKTLHEALEKLGYTQSFMAVAHNMRCIPKGEYATILLNENDEIEILIPQEGG